MISYYFIEKPKQDNIINSYNNLTLKVFLDNRVIEANYSIILYGNLYKEGLTNKDGYTLIQVPVNSSFDLILKGDNFYDYIETFNLKEEINIIRRDIFLTSIGELYFNYTNNFWENENLNLSFSSNKLFNIKYLCFSWSKNIINIYLDDFTIEDKKIERINSFKCYQDLLLLNNNTMNLNLRYIKTGENNNDFIKLFVIDCLRTKEDCIAEGGNKEDLGAKDYEFTIK